MNKEAILKARRRLNKAAKSLNEINKANSYSEFESSWSDFLISLSAVYNILEAGTKGKDKSIHWFGIKKGERRKDPLLQYIHQARNVDEHGIEPITREEHGNLIIGAFDGEPRGFTGSVASSDGIVVTAPPGMKPPDIIIPSTAKLVKVVDTRHQNEYEPPTTHLGKNIKDNNPLSVAKLSYEYVESMIIEAEELLI